MLATIDDDVAVPPDALRAMLTQGAEALISRSPDDDNGDDNGMPGEPCTVVTPTISTGIPTVERFARDFFSVEERAELFACFEGSENTGRLLAGWVDFMAVPGQWEKEDPGGTLRGPYYPFYEQVVEKNVDWLYPHAGKEGLENVALPASFFTIPGVGLGLHPVRWNTTCTAKVAAMARKRMASQTNNAFLERHATYIESLPRLAYFANSCWMTLVDNYERAIAQPDRLFWSHPFDEVPINLYLRESRAKFCVIRRTFVLHPT